MSTIITITNQKGGVGKTTTSSALMDGLRSRGARVLGVDLDPQGSLGFCLGLDIDNCATIYDVMKGVQPVRDVIVHSDCGDILPSNILLSGAELEFNKPGREFLLKNALQELQEEYDYIIVDTAPIGLVSDTFTLDRIADAAIYVCRANYTSLSDLAEVNDIYDRKRLKKLSLVINGSAANKTYGYGRKKSHR